MLETKGPKAPPDSPLLDQSDAAVKKLISSAKKRGYVTHEQLNAVLPSEEVSSDQIEDIYAMLNEMGINVVETEEAALEDEGAHDELEAEEAEGEHNELVEAKPKALDHQRGQGASRAHRRPGPHVPARDGLGRASFARGRGRDRQAHRGRPRGDDRRAVREPAHLPGDHHLAR